MSSQPLPGVLAEEHLLTADDLARGLGLLAESSPEPRPVILSPQGAEAYRRWLMDREVRHP